AALAFPSVGIAHGDHACENNQSEGYACSHVDFLGKLSVAQLGGMGADDSLNDLWGWTDPGTGKEYVIVGMRYGTSFVDVTDPTHPIYLGRIPAPPQSESAGFGIACHEDCGDGDSSW